MNPLRSFELGVELIVRMVYDQSFKRILTNYFKSLLIVITIAVFPNSKILANDGYAEVYQFLKICSIFGGLEISEGNPILHEECQPIFEDKYEVQLSSSMGDFNSNWVNMGGKAELTRTFSHGKLYDWDKRLSNPQANIRDKLYEQIKPNRIGLRSTNKASKTILNHFDTIAAVLYSQFSTCFGKMHNNARLTRELISKTNFLNKGIPQLSEKQMYVMDKSRIFYNDKDDCDAFDEAFNSVKENIVVNFKKNAMKSTPVTRQCKSTLYVISTTKSFDMNDYPKVCANHYKYNLERIRPIALRVTNAVKKEEMENNKTSSEELIN